MDVERLLTEFINKNDKIWYTLIKICINPEADYETIRRSIVELLNKTGLYNKDLQSFIKISMF